MDEELKYLIKTLAEGQARTDKSVSNLTALITSHVDLSEARAQRLEDAHLRTEESMQQLGDAHKRTEEAIASLAVTVDKYVASADARMKRIEENLDGLIRAITREHTNGKAH